jgi:hypothetical protein
MELLKDKHKGLELVEPNWNQEKLQQEFSRLISAYKLGIWTALADKPQELIHVMNSILSLYSSQLKNAQVNTPGKIVRHMAEAIVNLSGGVVYVSGDDKQATLVYESHPMWDEMKQQPAMQVFFQKEKLATITALYKDILEAFAANFNLSVEFSLPLERPLVEITLKAK